MGRLKKATKERHTKYQAMAQSTTPKHSDHKECYKFYYHIDTIEKWYSTEINRWTHRTTHGKTLVKIKWATDIVDALHQLEQDIGKIDHEYITENSDGFQTIRIARREKGMFQTKDGKINEWARTENISARQYGIRCNHEW